MKKESDPLLGGKNAVVTGGGSGIGRAIALRFARAGGRVAIVDITAESAAAAASEATALGDKAEAGTGRGRPQADVTDAFRDVEAQLGPVDILVNCAGVAHIGNVEQTTEEDLDRLYAVNVKGVYN